jgi:4'-phosphopantetheinyl transferase
VPSAMQIDIWCAFCASITDPALLERYRSLLTEAERSQEARFHFAADRHRYRITRALLRATLSRYADIPPERWAFVPNAHGRPAISNDCAEARAICFNLSHSRGLVVLAVCRGGELGIDTEDALARRPPLEIADRFFAPAEVASLRALPAEQQTERFFQYWTLKESYIKARGLGLSLPLDRFAFHFAAANRVQLTIDRQLQDEPGNWGFWQWWVRPAHALAEGGPERQHMLALCAQHVHGEAHRLTLTTIVPLVREVEACTTLIACSEQHAG